MKLYSMSASRYGARCLIQISAKGLDIPVELICYPPTASFQSINPLMLVPVLDIDGVLLPEAQVICEFLEDIEPSPPLRPDGPVLRARMRLLIRLFELYYDPAARKLYPLLLSNAHQRAEIANAALVEMNKYLELIAKHLSGEKYAVGGKLSLADCALMPPFAQARIICPALNLGDPIRENKIIASYFDATRTDPHVATVLDSLERHMAGIRPSSLT